MSRIYPLVGPAFLAFVLWRWVRGYGIDWHFGRWLMPESRIAADGLHHPSGRVVDELTRQLVASGLEAEAYFLLLVVVVLYVRHMVKLAKQITEQRRELEMWQRRIQELNNIR